MGMSLIWLVVCLVVWGCMAGMSCLSRVWWWLCGCGVLRGLFVVGNGL